MFLEPLDDGSEGVQADYDEYVGNKTAPYFVYVLIARLKKIEFC